MTIKCLFSKYFIVFSYTLWHVVYSRANISSQQKSTELCSDINLGKLVFVLVSTDYHSFGFIDIS